MKQFRNEHELHSKALRDELDNIAKHGLQLATGGGSTPAGGKAAIKDDKANKTKEVTRKHKRVDTGLGRGRPGEGGDGGRGGSARRR